jgi:chemotaxis protein CheX
VETPGEVVNAFVAAVETALREMAGVEAVASPVHPARGANDFGDLSAVLRLTAGAAGCVVLSTTAAAADAVARRILADVIPEPGPEMVRDCLGEVANVVAGQAKAHLAGTEFHFRFATPTVVTGRPTDVGATDRLVEFRSDAGPFTLHLCLDG